MTALRYSLVAFVVVLAAPAPAGAEVLCQYNPSSGSLTVAWNAAGDSARIFRRGNDLVVEADILAKEISCINAPTVDNTARIAVFDAAPNASDRVVLDFSGGPFAPDSDATAEIDIEVHMAPGGSDFITLRGSALADDYRLGDIAGGGGAKLNGDADLDLTYDGFGPGDAVGVRAAAGNDVVRADGGPGFTGPLTAATDLGGEAGDDALVGGNASDLIDDGPGDDRVDTGPANDFISPEDGPGADAFAGGAGTDLIQYEDGAVRADLRLTGPQDTGAAGRDSLSGIENVITGAGDDLLIGDDGSNVLLTNLGEDVVIGGGGPLDILDGGAGVDTLSYTTAPAGVRVDLAVASPATQATVGAGTDRVSGFENLAGSAFDDNLAGTDGANTISGLRGGDTIFARGGADALQIRDGSPDATSCGPGDDAVTADVAGTDTIGADCEITRLDVRPDTEIVSGPAGLTRDATPTFAFRSGKPGSRFECALDGGPYAACVSPRTLSRVSDGAHALRVRARDQFGARDLSPALRAFSIDATRPRITRARIAGGALRYRLSEDAAVTIKLQRRHKTVKTLQRGGHRGRNRAGLSRARADRVLLTARDRAGNRSTTTRLSVRGARR